MNADLLANGSGDEVRIYVSRKFREFKSGFFLTSRTEKCIKYWIAASPDNRRIVEDLYYGNFIKQFPTKDAQLYEKQLLQKAAGPRRVEYSEYVSGLNNRITDGEELLILLNKWKTEGEYQMGEGFYNMLVNTVHAYDSKLISPTQFSAECEVNRVAKLTGSYTKSAKEVNAEFEGMLGLHEHARLKFTADGGNWGEISAKLDQDLKLGMWAKGSAGARMERLGFSADVQGAIALGLELTIEGDCTWTKGNVGLDLGGSAEVFLGAKASGSANLSVSATQGLQMAFAAEAFAGFKAKASGNASFNYGGRQLASVDAEVYVLFGAGGSASGSISAPIFGPTVIAFDASGALGLGHGASATTAIHFTNIYLAGRTQFKKLMYMPTLARGYSMDLMTQEAENLHYLNKCITVIGEDVKSKTEQVSKMDRRARKSPEKVPLMQVVDY